jgi:hypothetical protein
MILEFENIELDTIQQRENYWYKDCIIPWILICVGEWMKESLMSMFELNKTIEGGILATVLG